MLFRVLTVRQHKTVTFCDAYSFESYRQQLVFYHSQFDCSRLVVGCIVDVQCHFGKNNRGLNVFFVDIINHFYIPANSSPYKGFQQKEDAVQVMNEMAQDLNGGVHLRQYKFRLLFLQQLDDLLRQKGFYKTHTPITTPYRGTSTAAPIKANGYYIGERFIKITHELELKKQCYLSFAPLYELGYVMRDRYATQFGLNEFLTLESVIPCRHSFDLGDFYFEILSMSRQLAEELDLQYAPIFDNLAVIDVAEIYSTSCNKFSTEEYIACYEEIIQNNPHCILRNAPLECPLGIAKANGLVMETKWLLNGHGFGHGYQDEYRADMLRKAFMIQQKQLLLKDIKAELPEDYLSICEYASIPTFSFNFGVDRYLSCFFRSELTR